MYQRGFPVIDPIATGENIVRLRKERGLSVRDLQAYFGFEEPQAIYKWQWGKSLPSVDNLYALGALLDVPMEEILVAAKPKLNLITTELGAGASGSDPFLGVFYNVRMGLSLNRWFFQKNVKVNQVETHPAKLPGGFLSVLKIGACLNIMQYISGRLQTDLSTIPMLQPGIEIAGIQFQICVDPVVGDALLGL